MIQESIPYEHEHGKEGAKSVNTEVLGHDQKEGSNDRTEKSVQEHEEILDAQEDEWIEKAEEVNQKRSLISALEAENKGKEIIPVETHPVSGEVEESINGNRLEVGISMELEMQMEEIGVEKKIGVRTRRGRRVKLLSKMDERNRQPLMEIQNLEVGNGQNTKRKFHIVDEEMADMAVADQTAKRNRTMDGEGSNNQIRREEETSPIWSLNQS